MGKRNVIKYAFTHLGKLFVIKKHMHQRFLGFLASVEPATGKQEARDPSGALIPPIMCRYFKGAQDTEIRTTLLNATKKSSYFDSASEKRLIRSLITMIFTPDQMIKTQELNPIGVVCVKKCVEQGALPCIHSTWDKQSFALLEKKYPEFFALFKDRIFISGQTGLMKPDLASFDNVLHQLQAPATECIFIDDRIENILAAQDRGIYSVLYRTNASFNDVLERVTALNAVTGV